jgi:uracil DNA glycosylase
LWPFPRHAEHITVPLLVVNHPSPLQFSQGFLGFLIFLGLIIT